MHNRWFLAGLFFATWAALALEMLDTRLLSVLTWYHLSFFAVSTAMLGMSAAAVHVFLAGPRLQGEGARRALGRIAFWFALSIPLSHILNLCIPIQLDRSLTGIAGFAISTLALAVPFYSAGLVVTVSLTRIEGAIGLKYATDMLGAALGCLSVIPLLSVLSLPSAVLVVSSVAMLSAFCFHRFAGSSARTAVILGLVLLGAGVANNLTRNGVRVLFSKGHAQTTGGVAFERWNTHSQVVATPPATERPSTGASPDPAARRPYAGSDSRSTATRSPTSPNGTATAPRSTG